MSAYTVESECESCCEEATITVDLPLPFTDDDVRNALDDSVVKCGGCGDIDWRRIGDPMPVVV